jgi:hypothetical protein
MRRVLSTAAVTLAVVLAGCSSASTGADDTSTAPATPTAAATAEPLVPLAVAEGAPQPKAIEGYEYYTAPAGVGTAMTALASAVPGAASGATAASIGKDGKQVGVLLLFTMEAAATPDAAVLTDVTRAFGGDAEPKPDTIEGKPVVVSEAAGQGTVAWASDGQVAVLMATDGATARDLATRYLTAA